MTWVVDDQEHVASLRLPANVRQAPAGRSLVDLMADGTLAAAFTGNAGIGRAGAPQENWQAAGDVTPARYPELFADAARREAEWHGRTGVYPIHGLVVVRDTVLDEHPQVAGALFDAFLASKADYLRRMATGDSGFDTDAHYRAMQEIVGDDPLPYGLEANRTSIDCMIRYCVEQGLLARGFAAGDFFIDPMA